MRTRFPRAVFCAALIVFLFPGCWYSEVDLIPDEIAVHPLGSGQFILWQQDGKDTLLERRNGQNQVFTLERMHRQNAVFTVFNPDPEGKQAICKVYEIVDLFSYFGRKKYIFMSSSEDKRYIYLYVERTGNEWALFFLHESDGGKGINEKLTEEKVMTLEELLTKIQNARKSGRLRPKGSLNLIAIDSTRAALHKQIAVNEYEKNQRKKEEARQAELRERERRQREEEEARQAKLREEERRRREEAERERLAKLQAQAEEAARRIEETRQQLADDREPTESEMSAAIRRTFAGALFNVSVTKLGRCRHLAPYDYYCRYRYVGVNWGNFWKDDGVWYFQIVRE
jgi:hypothetical protein